jgi:hypothetical protein
MTPRRQALVIGSPHKDSMAFREMSIEAMRELLEGLEFEVMQCCDLQATRKGILCYFREFLKGTQREDAVVSPIQVMVLWQKQGCQSGRRSPAISNSYYQSTSLKSSTVTPAAL